MGGQCTSPYQSVGAADAVEWACVLCGRHIQNDWASRASSFVLGLNIPLQKPFGLFRRPQLWATGNWQLHHYNTPTHASHLMQSFPAKHQITQVTQPPYSPDLAPCDFWIFPKLKSPLKGKRVHTVNEIQKNTMGQLMATGRTVWGPKVPTLMGPRHHCLIYNVSYIFFNKCLYFSYYMAGYLLDRPLIYTEVGFLDHLPILFKFFLGTSVLFSSVATPVYQQCTRVSVSPHHRYHLVFSAVLFCFVFFCFCFCFVVANLMGLR